MIKSLFLPEKIKDYYLFPKRVLGIEIGKTRIYATQVYLKGKHATVEKCSQHAIEANGQETFQQRASASLKELCNQFKFDTIHTALSSAHVVFKHMHVPFASHEKISQIISFEVEPLLPFALQDAVVDFIITKTYEDQSSDILIAAVQKHHLIQHLQIFESIGLSPSIITVDLFALYGLYKQIPSYAENPKSTVLFDLGTHSTRMAYINKGQLQSIRTIQKGVSTIAKSMAQKLQISPAQVMEQIIRFGLQDQDDTAFAQALQDEIRSYWRTIGFTFTSFTRNSNNKIEHILLLGSGAQLKGIVPFINNELQTKCELFDGNKIKSGTITLDNQLNLTSADLIALSAAIPSPKTMHFNLLKEDFTTTDTAFYKSCIASSILLLLILGTLLAHNIIQVNKLSHERAATEQEAVTALKEQFPNIDDKRLEDALDSAQVELEQEEKTWFAFSSHVRSSFLKYLLELHERIDKDGLSFDVDKVSIEDNAINLIGHVNDFDAFRNLRKTIKQSELFGAPEAKEELDFTMTIPLAKPEEQ